MGAFRPSGWCRRLQQGPVVEVDLRDRELPLPAGLPLRLISRIQAASCRIWPTTLAWARALLPIPTTAPAAPSTAPVAPPTAAPLTTWPRPLATPSCQVGAHWPSGPRRRRAPGRTPPAPTLAHPGPPSAGRGSPPAGRPPRRCRCPPWRPKLPRWLPARRCPLDRPHRPGWPHRPSPRRQRPPPRRRPPPQAALPYPEWRPPRQGRHHRCAGGRQVGGLVLATPNDSRSPSANPSNRPARAPSPNSSPAAALDVAVQPSLVGSPLTVSWILAGDPRADALFHFLELAQPPQPLGVGAGSWAMIRPRSNIRSISSTSSRPASSYCRRSRRFSPYLVW